MATTNKLTDKQVRDITEPGYVGDGGGLWLQVAKRKEPDHKPKNWVPVSKSWLFRYKSPITEKAREMGLGPYPDITLKDSRDKAAACRRLLIDKKDPLLERDATLNQQRKEAAKQLSFQQCALAYMDAHKAGWKNEKHIQQWENTLTSYVYPVFGDISVRDVDVAMVLKSLEPIWKTKNETASRLRGRIEVIIDWATARGYRTGDNPARWKGHLENLLAKPSKIRRVKHQAALPYDQISEFMAEIKVQEGVAPLAMQFTILTACRTSEAIGATWDEIDLEKKLWIVPANRIKAGREHRVPLSDAVLKILTTLQSMSQGKPTKWVFMGARNTTPLSNMAMLQLLKRMNRQDITVHGFRSTFRDWAAEQTNFPREVAEMALAHAVGDKVEAAYRRGDMFEKRRQLMAAWAKYCEMPAVKSGNVRSLHGGAA